ncbi:RsmB/NOP family class I SAM-dependent RNA methyltransferase [Salinarimonas sp.]|uniref:RsmB/NOP family class I SAM-dependent RNA methyltransferase n=1 Tax=Salinarimonas sp. TaxID=2766526 RepID=UPI00391DA3DA
MSPADDATAGLAPRRLALDGVAETLRAKTSLDDVLAARGARLAMEPRDRALARAIAVATMRRLGTIRTAIAQRLDRPVEDPRLEALLAIGAAQILFLDVPDHAAVGTAVAIASADRRLARAGGLVNAVLRRIAREAEAIRAEAAADPMRDTPDWLAARWRKTYGADVAGAIARACRAEADLDLTTRGDPAEWVAPLDAILLPTGSLRLRQRTPVPDLPGYAEGAWWVQDAAAAMPARLLAPRPGERIADLCAAPGGKTAQLAAAGARVLAVDRSRERLARLEENLARLRLEAEIRVADATALPEREAFDAVLVDAPCSSTGTLRRHPDVAWTKSEADIAALAAIQTRLIDAAIALVRPGGRIVYCTCSLEPEEGEAQARTALEQHPGLVREPIRPEEVGGLAAAVTRKGDLRILPSHALLPEAPGLDGFFAARFRRAST